MKSSYTRKNRKTIKPNVNLNSVSVKYYSDNFKNTKTLPKSNIIKYMFKYLIKMLWKLTIITTN